MKTLHEKIIDRLQGRLEISYDEFQRELTNIRFSKRDAPDIERELENMGILQRKNKRKLRVNQRRIKKFTRQ